MNYADFYNSNSDVYITESNQIQGWEDYINRIPMLKTGVKVLKKIEKEGGPKAKAYIVGGAVRDIITGEKEPDDIDIATNLTTDQVEKIFGKSHDIGKNKDFGIAIITVDGEDMEVATFRTDGTYSDGRRPDSVEIVMDFETDAGRRDFTINAMGVDAEGNVVDYFDGQKDIKNKVIQTVGDPDQRFEEDYIRMLRAVRFGSRLGFNISDGTMKAIQKLAKNITPKKKKEGESKEDYAKRAGVAGERIFKELKKMAEQEGPKFAEAIKMLDKSGMLQYILPEVAKMKEFEHSVEHHPEGGVWEHTLAALASSQVKDPIVNLGILLHDVGKIKTHSIENGMHKYLQHAKAADDLIEIISQRFALDNDSTRKIQFAAANHMKMHDLLKMSNSKIAKLMDDDAFDILVKVSEADAKARGKLFDARGWQSIIDKIGELAEKYKDRNAIEAIKRVVNGRWVMELKGLKGGPDVGNVIGQTVEWILNNNVDINDTEKIKDYILKI